MRKGLKILLWIVGVLVVIGAVAFFVMFGPPKVSESLAKPQFCGSCHEMEPWLSGFKATKHSVLKSCNDCHLPHSSKVAYYSWEAVVGIRDLAMHTVRWIPDPIEATNQSRGWLNTNCHRCHDDELEEGHGSSEPFCWDCHADVIHQVKQSSSTPRRKEVRLYVAQLTSPATAYGTGASTSPCTAPLGSCAGTDACLQVSGIRCRRCMTGRAGP